MTLNRLYDLSEVVDDHQAIVTDKQRETLLTAYDQGYYERPRDIDQQALLSFLICSSHRHLPLLRDLLISTTDESDYI